MRTFREMHCRCFSRDYEDIPFRVRSTGHYLLSPEMEETVIKRDFIELYWCIAGEGVFVIDGNEWVLRPGHVCFYINGDEHRLGARTERFHYRWITFDGIEALSIWRGLRLRKYPRLAGTCPDELFCRLIGELSDYSPDGMRKVASTGFEILMRSASNPRREVSGYDYAVQAREVIDTDFRDQTLNIGHLADLLAVNRSQLSRRFRDLYGLSPMDYLIQRRMQYGIGLIGKTGKKLRDIAHESGFSDPNYFSRRIRKYAGVPARELRPGS